jgi:hypothetical protein
MTTESQWVAIANAGLELHDLADFAGTDLADFADTDRLEELLRAHVAVHGNFTAGSPAGLSAEDAAKYVVGGLVVDGEWAVFVVTRAATAWVRDRFGEDTAEELKIFFRAFIESTANLNPPRWRGPDV